MNDIASLDATRPERDFWDTVLRRLGRKLLDPECIRDILDEQERQRALLAEIDLGEEHPFLLLNFGVHRIWCVGMTVRHAPYPDGRENKETLAVLEQETGRTLRAIADGTALPRDREAPLSGFIPILPEHMLEAATHPVKPHDIRAALMRQAPGIEDAIDLDGLDAIGLLRVHDHLLRHGAQPGDSMAMRRAFKHAMTMRDDVRRCFSRKLDLWDGAPIRDDRGMP